MDGRRGSIPNAQYGVFKKTNEGCVAVSEQGAEKEIDARTQKIFTNITRPDC